MKKKVLHIIGRSSYDGTCTYALRLAGHLSDFQSTLLFIRKGSALNEIADKYNSIFQLSKRQNENYLYLFVLLIKFISILIKNQYDIIHFHSGGKSFLIVAFLLRSRAKFVHHLHCGNIFCNNKRDTIGLIDKLILTLMEKRSQKIFVSNHIQLFLKNNFKEIKNSNLVLNAVPYIFQPKNKTTKTLGYIGQISKAKGFDTLIGILEKLNSDDEKFNFIAKGDLYDANIKENTNIKIMPPSFVIEDFFKSIDILLFPSNAPFEGRPLVILEALSFDVAVIAINNKVNNEILRNYPLLLDSFTDENVIKKINYFYDTKNMANIAEAHKSIVDSNSYSNHLKQIISIYNK